MTKETKYFNAFNLTGVLGPSGFRKLIDFFPSLENAWRAGVSELKQAGLSQATAEKIAEKRKGIEPEKELEKIAKENVRIVTIADEKYPVRLKQIADPPAMLYVKGEILSKDELCLGIVGSRQYSSYGKEAALKLAGELAAQGITVVSGLALGIDAFAHQAALNAGGRTLAVLGSGLGRKVIYPASNQKLAEKIVESGALISEFPLEARARVEYFPMRNRVISGLSLGVLVIEAKEKSGALITANQALEQNREVFAVPGSIFSANSAGTNNLIKQGAKIAARAEDVLEELNIMPIKEKRTEFKAENPEEKFIFDLIADSSEPLHIDKIIILSKLNAAIVGSRLSLLELKGLIKNIGGGNYIKK